MNEDDPNRVQFGSCTAKRSFCEQRLVLIPTFQRALREILRHGYPDELHGHHLASTNRHRHPISVRVRVDPEHHGRIQSTIDGALSLSHRMKSMRSVGILTGSGNCELK